METSALVWDAICNDKYIFTHAGGRAAGHASGEAARRGQGQVQPDTGVCVWAVNLFIIESGR